MSNIERVDKYNLKINGHIIPCNDPETEERLRAMSDDEMKRFLKVMGHG